MLQRLSCNLMIFFSIIRKDYKLCRALYSNDWIALLLHIHVCVSLELLLRVFNELCTLHELLIFSHANSVISLVLWIHCMNEKVWILISWLLLKPADLDLHCF